MLDSGEQRAVEHGTSCVPLPTSVADADEVAPCLDRQGWEG